VLELGGSDPFILLSTDDLDAAVGTAVTARLQNTGQACNAGKRFIVVDDLYEPFLEKFTPAITAVKPADPMSDATRIGPLSSSTATDRLDDQVRRAIDEGATLVAGGGRDGNFFSTTVLTDITPDNDAYCEEFFGPVASVYRVASEDEAVELANDTPFGLGSYVMTVDPDQALRVVDQIDDGMVFINGVGLATADVPFGGVKRSGFGRELGRFGLEEFVNKKLIRVAGRRRRIGQVLVDADRAGLNATRDVRAVVGIRRPDGPAEPVLGVVGDPDGILLAVVGDHREHRSEDLLTGDRLIVGDIGEDGRLHEPAAPLRSSAAGHETSTLFLCGADVALDSVAVARGRHRTDHRVRVKRVTDRHPLGDRGKRFDDFLIP